MPDHARAPAQVLETAPLAVGLRPETRWAIYRLESAELERTAAERAAGRPAREEALEKEASLCAAMHQTNLRRLLAARNRLSIAQRLAADAAAVVDGLRVKNFECNEVVCPRRRR